MAEIAHTAAQMIGGMDPALRDGEFVFATVAEVPDPGLISVAVGTFREDEGLSLILPLPDAAAAGLPTDQPMCCITLQVHSSLDGVGLTAAVATALAKAGIACNMVAAFHHDHAFVPSADAERALEILKALQSGH